jgi:hypothetical protein
VAPGGSFIPGAAAPKHAVNVGPAPWPSQHTPIRPRMGVKTAADADDLVHRPETSGIGAWADNPRTAPTAPSCPVATPFERAPIRRLGTIATNCYEFLPPEGRGVQGTR